MISFYLRKATQSAIALLVTVLIAAPTFSHDYYYTGKLFGKAFIFTPMETEIVIKFSTNASLSKMRDIAKQYRLSEKTEGLEKLHYGGFELPGGVSFDVAKDELSKNIFISGVLPVFVDQEGYERYIDPEWFTVRFAADISQKEAEETLNRWGSKIVIDHWTPGYYTVTVPVGMTVFEAVREFMKWPEVMFTDPTFYGFNDLLDDTYLNQQWHLENTGQVTGYTVGNDINAFSAWNITLGDPNVVLAIIDTGIDLTHPDLAGNILPRGSEDWDFANWDLNQLEPNDSEGHGTCVSGTAVAIANNIGVRGVAPSCRVMPLQVEVNAEKIQQRIDAINYAVGRRNNFTRMLISCSWEHSGDSEPLHLAIQDAVNNNVPVFCAAGNDNTSPIAYPARYSETISVGAMAPCGELRKEPTTCDGEYWGSNFGEDLDIAAPGMKLYMVDIQGIGGFNGYRTPPGSDLSDQNYTRLWGGTSAACPQVSATAALMLSVNPDLTVEEVRSIIQATGDTVGDYNYHWNPSKLGYGRLNAYQALLLSLGKTSLTGG